MAPQNSDKDLIVKKTIYTGTQAVSFKDGTKVFLKFFSIANFGRFIHF